MNKVFYCLLSACLLLIAACRDKDDAVLDVPKNNPPTPSVEINPSATLKYILTCGNDLTTFVIPEITYTDSLGTHSVFLDESTWSPKTYAWCYKEEDDVTTYTGILVDQNGQVPEPWIIESYITNYSWEQEVHLNKVGIVNECMVKFHRKNNCMIDLEKKYELSYYFNCVSGSSSTVVDGKIVNNNYSHLTIDINGQSSRYGHEVEKYLDELCAKIITISMKIDSNGEISQE